MKVWYLYTLVEVYELSVWYDQKTSETYTIFQTRRLHVAGSHDYATSPSEITNPKTKRSLHVLVNPKGQGDEALK